MSYCRKGDDSDLYIIGTGDGFECLACPHLEHYESFRCKTVGEMYEHAIGHQHAQHKVPLDALDRLWHDAHDIPYIDPEVELERLCHALSAPRRVMDFIAQTGSLVLTFDVGMDGIEPPDSYDPLDITDDSQRRDLGLWQVADMIDWSAMTEEEADAYWAQIHWEMNLPEYE